MAKPQANDAAPAKDGEKVLPIAVKDLLVRPRPRPHGLTRFPFTKTCANHGCLFFSLAMKSSRA